MDTARMLFSATDWAFFPRAKDPESYYDRLKVIGYDGVEMVDALRWEKARAAGLQLVNMAGPGMVKGLKDEHSERGTQESPTRGSRRLAIARA